LQYIIKNLPHKKYPSLNDLNRNIDP